LLVEKFEFWETTILIDLKFWDVTCSDVGEGGGGENYNFHVYYQDEIK
jgi:hypothetical protein